MSVGLAGVIKVSNQFREIYLLKVGSKTKAVIDFLSKSVNNVVDIKIKQKLLPRVDTDVWIRINKPWPSSFS